MGWHVKFMICVFIVTLFFEGGLYVSSKAVQPVIERRRSGTESTQEIDKALKNVDNLNEYLTVLCEVKDHYTIFIVAQSEASKRLRRDARASLKNLGLHAEWKQGYQKSYCAVIENGKVVYEEMSPQKIEHSGTFGGGSYTLSSAGYKVGRSSSIRLNGKEAGVCKRGLNIVVFGTQRGKIVDSVCFDTFDDKNTASR